LNTSSSVYVELEIARTSSIEISEQPLIQEKLLERFLDDVGDELHEVFVGPGQSWRRRALSGIDLGWLGSALDVAARVLRDGALERGVIIVSSYATLSGIFSATNFKTSWELQFSSPRAKIWL